MPRGSHCKCVRNSNGSVQNVELTFLCLFFFLVNHLDLTDDWKFNWKAVILHLQTLRSVHFGSFAYLSILRTGYLIFLLLLSLIFFFSLI